MTRFRHIFYTNSTRSGHSAKKVRDPVLLENLKKQKAEEKKNPVQLENNDEVETVFGDWQ